MRRFLTRAPVLLTFFALFVAITISFSIIMPTYDFSLIDVIWQPEAVTAHIEAMSHAQRRIHIVTTATLDVVYPIAYGGLFAGLALRFLPKEAAWLALPGLIVIPVDLVEGVVQIMALTGHDAGLGLKAILTPLKLGLFGLGAIIAFVAVLAGAIQMLRRSPP